MIKQIERMRKLVNDNLVMNLRFQMNGELNKLEREIEQELNSRAERTCENVGYYIDDTRFKCSECGYNGWTKWAKDGEDRIPSYCPNCGCKVVGE